MTNTLFWFGCTVELPPPVPADRVAQAASTAGSAARAPRVRGPARQHTGANRLRPVLTSPDTKLNPRPLFSPGIWLLLAQCREEC